MKRKAVRKSGHTLKHDAMNSLGAASAQALGLTLDPSWETGVAFNLQLILRHAALVDEFPLPDDAEPAPIFRP
jgi:1-carboxybiuret hydrolase subunit AtzG-like protein